MKRVLGLAIAVLFSLSTVCMARVAQSEVAIGGIGWGAFKSYVELIYGKPDSSRDSFSNGGIRITTVKYGDLTIVYSGGFVIDMAIHENNSLGTPAGVTCGMDLSVLKKVYGDPDNVYSARGGTIYVYAGTQSNGENKGVLEFDVRNNKIVQIEIW